MLAKVFPVMFKDGNEATAEAIGHTFAPKGPGHEDGILSFHICRDSSNVNYPLFVEHFAD